MRADSSRTMLHRAVVVEDSLVGWVGRTEPRDPVRVRRAFALPLADGTRLERQEPTGGSAGWIVGAALAVSFVMAALEYDGLGD